MMTTITNGKFDFGFCVVRCHHFTQYTNYYGDKELLVLYNIYVYNYANSTDKN